MLKCFGIQRFGSSLPDWQHLCHWNDDCMLPSMHHAYFHLCMCWNFIQHLWIIYHVLCAFRDGFSGSPSLLSSLGCLISLPIQCIPNEVQSRADLEISYITWNTHLERIVEFEKLTLDHWDSAFHVDVQADKTIKLKITMEHFQQSIAFRNGVLLQDIEQAIEYLLVKYISSNISRGYLYGQLLSWKWVNTYLCKVTHLVPIIKCDVDDGSEVTELLPQEKVSNTFVTKYQVLWKYRRTKYLLFLNCSLNIPPKEVED